MFNRRSIIVLLAALLVTGTVVLTAVALTDARVTDSSAAKRAIEAQSGLEASDVRESTFGLQRPVYEGTLADGSIALLDANSGRVMGRSGVVSKAEVRGATDVETMRARAIRYLEREMPGFDEMQLVSENHPSDKVVEFRWVAVAPSGAELPQWAMLVADLSTGDLVNFKSRHEPLTISTEPAVEQAEAERAGLSTLAQEPDSRECVLRVENDSSGQQRLIWIFAYQLYRAQALPNGETGYVPIEDFEIIDAQTGNVVTSDFR